MTDWPHQNTRMSRKSSKSASLRSFGLAQLITLTVDVVSSPIMMSVGVGRESLIARRRVAVDHTSLAEKLLVWRGRSSCPSAHRRQLMVGYRGGTHACLATRQSCSIWTAIPLDATVAVGLRDRCCSPPNGQVRKDRESQKGRRAEIKGLWRKNWADRQERTYKQEEFGWMTKVRSLKKNLDETAAGDKYCRLAAG